MPALIVDMDSVPDMMSALDQIAARVAELELSIFSAEVVLAPDEVVYCGNLPLGSTEAFADELWELTSGTDVAALVRSLALFALSGCPFAFSDLTARFGMTTEFLCRGLRQLGEIEDELGAQLIESTWIRDDGAGGPGCVCYTMHPDVRDRLLVLLP